MPRGPHIRTQDKMQAVRITEVYLQNRGQANGRSRGRSVIQGRVRKVQNGRRAQGQGSTEKTGVWKNTLVGLKRQDELVTDKQKTQVFNAQGSQHPTIHEGQHKSLLPERLATS
jgi:hypothetical protein